MGAKSRRKGRDGEQELARELRTLGWPESARRQQHCGAAGDDDVSWFDGAHLECKRTETLSLYRAMSQAISDREPGAVPVVVHRRNAQPWLAIVRLQDSELFCLRLLSSLGYKITAPPDRRVTG